MASTRSVLLLALVALAGVADQAAAARPPLDAAELHGPAKKLPVTSASASATGVDDHAVDAAEEQISTAVKRAAASASSAARHGTGAAAELDGLFDCMIGCITTVMNCAFGCMAKGPDLPLCVISCNQKSIVCMIRCAMTPSPPGPKPPAPGPKPPAPKPSPPKPPAPAPPPYAAHGTETST